MSDNQKEIIDHASLSIKSDTVVSEATIASLVDAFSKIFPVIKEEREQVIKILHARFAIRMDRGAVVKEKNHLPWYAPAKKTLPDEYWKRYTQYLVKDKNFSPNVINSIDEATDEMMDLLGDPRTENDFQRRGLVIGDVQSGKTASYTALINKASDAGYKIIILLTGTIEKLRQQTQKRLDEGFIGLDSTAFTHGRDDVFVGVGIYNPNISGWAVTSTTSDFRRSSAQRLTGQLANISVPVLFVIKKNRSVLSSLEQWLRFFNTTPGHPVVSPMLLIDDEADNASVNTKSAEDPAVINSYIRRLLNLFSKANYVGFTATPFANIFIDPESSQEMLKDDLFPRDFIYALDAPSNYVGAQSIFSKFGKHAYMRKSNDDCEKYIPEKHKKDFILEELPPTLKEAIASFFIANTIKDLRGFDKSHRTMLINVSRFIAVQNHLEKVVNSYIRELQREVKNYYLIGEEALKYNEIRFIKSVYDKYFSDSEFPWHEIQIHLHPAIAPIVVRTVNGGNASKNLNYEEYKEEGLRLITVGGYSLSRGLTLEGLCVSYFFRNSKMYDTLMQMGRWFGYRDGYEDICQIWMNEGAVEWYEYISEATEELRREVRRMQDENKTPKEFGLRVRSDKDLLLVTARNKMKTAEDFIITVSLNGKVVETPYLHLDMKVLQENLNLINSWAKSLKDDGYEFKHYDNLALTNFQILNIPKRYISDLLSSFKSHSLNVAFRTGDLVEIINKDSEELVNWDVVIAHGGGNTLELCGMKVSCARRNFGIKNEAKALQMSGKNSRIGESQFAKGGLTKQQVEEIELRETKLMKNDANIKSFSENLYFRSNVKRNPLLVIYPVELRPSEKSINKEEKQKIADIYNPPLIGLSIGIPAIEGREDLVYRYKINKVMQKELLDVDADGEENNPEEEDGIYEGGVSS